MLEVEATGKNLEQAIANALFELKAPREDVDILEKQKLEFLSPLTK